MARFDTTFIDALKNDEAKAYERLQLFSYRYAFEYLRNKEDAEDIAADAVIRIRKAIKRYRPSQGKGGVEANFKAWLRKIIFRAYLDFREKKQREVTLDVLVNAMNLGGEDREAIEGDFESIDTMFGLKAYESHPFKGNPEWTLALIEVFGVVRKLKEPRKRIALLLKYLYNFKTHEIASLMGENFDAIQTVIHRTRAEMMAIYQEHGIDADYLSPESWRIKHLKR
jgi:RNA polymerase sigma factor (sigma-70 family)